MARMVLPLVLRKSWLVAACSLIMLAGLGTPVALGQHGGGHVGGGAHFSGGGPHVSGPAPHMSAQRSTQATPHAYRALAGPPPAGAGTRQYYYHRHPVQVAVVPFLPWWGFGGSFFGYGAGFGFNSVWWPGCDTYFGLGYNCGPSSYYGSPYYGYGFGNNVTAPAPTYVAPEYEYRGGANDLPQLYLKDGTVYDVTDYWVVDQRVHFTMIEEVGVKPSEHMFALDQLDLQKTIDVNTRRGFKFMLRNEPVEKYLEHHPDTPMPAERPQPDN